MMAQIPSVSQGLRSAAGTPRELAPWIVRAARIGYVAKAIVYIVVGVLAARAAFGAGGRTTDSRGALASILEQPFGQVLLVLMALGLFGYAGWRLLAAITDPEGKGTDAKGIGSRLGDAGAAIVHAALGISAVRLVAGSGGGSDDQGAQDWTAKVLSVPLGRWLVGIVAAGVIAYAVYQLYRAYAAKLSKQLDLSSLGADAARWAIRFGRFGLAARGVVFVLIGIFLIRAATQSDASEARGLGGALQELEGQTSIPWLFGAVALGLVAYGLYQLVEARYRRIRAP
jgi:uncharacterized protein DUF1206